MTSRANYEQGQSFETDEVVEEELSPSKQLLAMVRLGAWHLRRLVVFVPIFGLVFLAVGFMWLKDVQTESSLNSEIKQLNILLDQPSPQPEALLRQADGWGTAYQVVMSSRVTRPADSDLVQRVIDAAADSGVLITETGTTLDSPAILENETFTSTPLLISAIGTIEGIESYLALLETDEFSAFGIDSTIVEKGVTAYQLTLRGLYYSLPENFGESEIDSEDAVIAVTPIALVDEGVAK
jgi:hypothetical protein